MAPTGHDVDKSMKNTKKGSSHHEGDNAGDGEEADYAEAVTRHAKYLGIDPEHDAAYMWIAEEVWDTCLRTSPVCVFCFSPSLLPSWSLLLA